MVEIIFIKLRCSAVEAKRDLRAGLVASFLDRLKNQLNGFFMAFDRWRKTTLIADGCSESLVMQDFFQCVEYLSTVTDRLTKTRCAHRNNHELLNIQIVICVRATIDDIHHRNRHLHRARATKIAV